MRRVTRRPKRTNRRTFKRKVFRRGRRNVFRRRTRAGQTGSSNWTNNYGRQTKYAIQHLDGFDEEYVSTDPDPTFAIFRLGGDASDPRGIASQWGSLIQQQLGSTIQQTIISSGGSTAALDGNRPPILAFDWLTIRIRVTMQLWESQTRNNATDPNKFADNSIPLLKQNRSMPVQPVVYWGDNFEIDLATVVTNPSEMTERDLNDLSTWRPAKADKNGVFHYIIRWRNKLPYHNRGIRMANFTPTGTFNWHPSMWIGQLGIVSAQRAPLHAASNDGFPMSMIMRVPAMRILVDGATAQAPTASGDTVNTFQHAKLMCMYDVRGGCRVTQPTVI